MMYNGPYKITSPQGPRGGGIHNGIDFVGLSNKIICAVKPGRVARSRIVTDKSDRTWEWGNYVAVTDDDGITAYYCHLSQRLVAAGQSVRAGDHLGVEGSTGYSTGSHLHFEARNSAGAVVSAAEYLGIPGTVGTYSGDNYRARVQARFGFDAATMAFLDGHPYAADLYRKLVSP